VRRSCHDLPSLNPPRRAFFGPRQTVAARGDCRSSGGQALFDIAENGLILGMLAQGGTVEPWLIHAASNATALKWISAALALGAASGLGVWALLKWIRRRQVISERRRMIS